MSERDTARGVRAPEGLPEARQKVRSASFFVVHPEGWLGYGPTQRPAELGLGKESPAGPWADREDVGRADARDRSLRRGTPEQVRASADMAKPRRSLADHRGPSPGGPNHRADRRRQRLRRYLGQCGRRLQPGQRAATVAHHPRRRRLPSRLAARRREGLLRRSLRTGDLERFGEAECGHRQRGGFDVHQHRTDRPSWTSKIYKTYLGCWTFTSANQKLRIGGDFTGEQVGGKNTQKPYLAAYPGN